MTLREISQTKKPRTILFTNMWDIKLKATNKQKTRTNKQRCIYTNNTLVFCVSLSEGKGIGDDGQLRIEEDKYTVTEDWTWDGGTQCNVHMTCH